MLVFVKIKIEHLIFLVSVCACLTGILLMLAFLVRAQNDNNAIVPNSVLPAAVSSLFGPTYALQSLSTAVNARLAYVSPLVPWTTTDGQRVVRSKVKCKHADCIGFGYVIQLPVLVDLERPSEKWPEYANAWNLDTLLMSTGSNDTYPLVTVIKVPKDAPEQAKFIIDADLEPVGPQGQANSKALNVTGAYAGSFVIQNKSMHTIFFTRTSSPTETTYWSIAAESNVLVWPSNPYQQGLKSWQATRVNPFLSDEECAYMAETIMFSRL